MKLLLKNVRCYKEYSLEVSNMTAFILGASGAGKSTIIDSILFCLTGKGKNMAQMGSFEPFFIEMTFGAVKIKRTKTNVFFSNEEGTVSDIVAQEKIAAFFGRNIFSYSQNSNGLFLELAPREQLETLEEVLFGDEIDMKELKARFCAEKRNQDAVQKELNAARELTREFLAKMEKGSTPGARVSSLTAAQVEEFKSKRSFLKNRVILYECYLRKVEELEQDIVSLRIKTAPLDMPISFSRDELEEHLRCARALEDMNWQKYMSYTIEECNEELEGYREEKDVLERACGSFFICPWCESHVELRGGLLRAASGAQDLQEEAKEIILSLGAPNLESALKEIENQIRLFENYSEKRTAIDSLKKKILAVDDAADLLQKVKNKEKICVLAELLQEKEEHLRELKECAARDGVEEWGAHIQELRDIEEYLRGAELFSLKEKEQGIKEEYEARLADLEEKSRMAASRQRGLARASAILAETEQQYLNDMIEQISSEFNKYSLQMFSTETHAPNLCLKIEGTNGGARKLRVLFDEGRPYETFSGGERARLNLCMLLSLANFQNYRILLLDEFTRFLDAENAARVFKTLRNNFDGLIVAAEHDTMFEGEKVWIY